MNFNESVIEQAAIDWLQELGYNYAFGPEIAFDGEAPERPDYQRPFLLDRLRNAVQCINPGIPEQAREEAIRKITYWGNPSLPRGDGEAHGWIIAEESADA